MRGSGLAFLVLADHCEKYRKAGVWTRWERGSQSGLSRSSKRGSATLTADIVVPVPLHRERQRERGCHQGTSSPRPWPGAWGCRIEPCGWSARGHTRQTGAQPVETLGVRPWRFCYAAGQPS